MGSVILIVDFSDAGGGLGQKTFVGDDGWREFVKTKVCYGAPTVGSSPVDYDVDFIIGPSTANHAAVESSSAPILTATNQVMGKSQKSWDYLANNLLGFIYMC